MKLNCDLGEGLDHLDRQIIPMVDQVNVACGGHAGDQQSIYHCLRLAKENHTEVGLHPSYPDRENFGRVQLDISEQSLRQSLLEQCSFFLNCASGLGIVASYLKPHGALYNAMVKDFSLFCLIINVLKELQSGFALPGLRLMCPASVMPLKFLQYVQQQQVKLLFEGFADRAYCTDGSLMPRSLPGAVLTDHRQVLERVNGLVNKKGLRTTDGDWLALEIDSLCVHGDTPGAVEMVRAIRKQILPIHV